MDRMATSPFVSRLRDFAGSPTRVRLIFFLLVLAAILGVWFLRGLLPDARTVVGYPSIFVLNFMAAFSMVVPIPAIATVCAGGVILIPVVVAMVAGTAETLGEMSGYALGYTGRGVIEKRKVYVVARDMMERRGSLMLFIGAMIPNPFFDVLGVVAGSLRFPIRRFLPPVWAGKVAKSLWVAYGCLYSIELVTDYARRFIE